MQESTLERSCFQNVVYMVVSDVNFAARHDYYLVYFTTSFPLIDQNIVKIMKHTLKFIYVIANNQIFSHISILKLKIKLKHLSM